MAFFSCQFSKLMAIGTNLCDETVRSISKTVGIDRLDPHIFRLTGHACTACIKTSFVPLPPGAV